jgi:hopanoid biosynthesis associated radical SAM protein HpnH
LIYSPGLSAAIVRHMYRNKRRGNSRYPFVLMLEPLFKCNLACSGCGRIREYRDVMGEMMNAEECMDAARQAQAPIVSLTGGEPLLHPEISRIAKELLDKGYFVYLCTNGLLLEDFLDDIDAHPRLSFVVHLDGMEKTHDHFTGKKGVFETALKAIRKAKELGFSVRSNTTIYRDTDPGEITGLFRLLRETGTDGVMVSPAFSYEVLGTESFLARDQIHSVFSDIYRELDGTRLYNTPIYWDFLRGEKQLKCIPWSTPTYNLKGWKSPCYLITDTHYPGYMEMIENTDWEKYGTGRDPRCVNCMAHCGYEASSIQGKKDIRDMARIIKWNMTGRS